MELDSRYDPKSSEVRWQKFWEEKEIYKYDPTSDKKVFSIDTPPPTVSGKLHIGHVFSYTQAEVIARYHRMLGENVMYPFGFDDNGLPTEILTEREKGIKGSDLPREEFNQYCKEVSKEYRGQFKELWQRLGFSCDWSSAYTTISESSQRISQRSFLDLLKKSHVEYKEDPTLWCTKCQTSFAQAEIDDVNKGSVFNYLNFKSEAGEDIPIATTRPELLPGCVAMLIHPDNSKYKQLIGQDAIVPIFNHKVKIIADEKADPEKGTGIVMCCTFGDVTDIEWWREHNLDLRICFTQSGMMNERAGEFEGLYMTKAREAIISKMLDEKIIFKQVDLDAESRIVNTHERCGTPVEYIPTKQWFIKVVENKEALIKQGEKVNWYPSYMFKRYKDWVENLSWDWAISRQRYFGVPIPVWYAPDGTVLTADESQLPVNPLVDKPLDCKGYDPESLIPERDVLDTWATSSITPQLNSRWGEPNEDKKLFPMTMRPQAHDIIRTWAFYTIVKAYYHFDEIPWQDAVISGHVIKKDQKVESQKVEGKAYERKSKISKSKDGDKFSPLKILDEFSSDTVRYWACTGTLGMDIAYDEEEIDSANKLLNKLWNSSRFAIPFIEDFNPNEKMPKLEAIDSWALSRFNNVIKQYHKSYEKYDFFPARNELVKFFWGTFCDNYLELVKDRFWNPEKRGEESAYAAKWTLYSLLLGQLKLFAPYIPHITEELYQALFKDTEGDISIHVSSFPKENDDFEDELSSRAGDLLLDLLTLVRTYKSKNSYSMKLQVDTLTVACSEDVEKALRKVDADVKAITKTANIIYQRECENPFDDKTSELSIEVKMDEDAMYRTELLGKIKPIVSALKKDAGLKAKNPIAKIYIKAEGKILKSLEEEPSSIIGVVKAREVLFNDNAMQYTATEEEGLEVAISVE
ncbi:MAG: valine--tRNA ligase [Planctomycetota bacterium]|nr:MAG: valine--tRNA ligase [Planctomycetota bacterium]